jgi:DNA-binding Lrp family transcriptional regulator
MAKVHNGMRPQDIVVLLKKIAANGRNLTNGQIAEELSISVSEVSEALERCRVARLIDASKKHVNLLALKEFLVHGLRYVYPVQPQGKVRGIATAVSAPPLNEKIQSDKEVYVWPDPKGNMRGASIEPLYRTVPAAVVIDKTLHELLSIVDTFRIGRIREIEIAKVELDKILDTYDIN